MHDSLRIPALDTTPPISSQPIENTRFAQIHPGRQIRRPRQRIEACESAVGSLLSLHARRLFLELFCDELEELLCVLVLAGGEEGGAFAGFGVGERFDYGHGADGAGVRLGLV